MPQPDVDLKNVLLTYFDKNVIIEIVARSCPHPTSQGDTQMFRRFRDALAAINDARNDLPVRVAVIDTLVVVIATFGLLYAYATVVNFAGAHWQFGTMDVLGSDHLYVGNAGDWTLILGVVAIVTLAVSYIANDTFYRPERRSMIVTTLAVVLAVALIPSIVLLAGYILGHAIALGDVLTITCALGLVCVPAALTLTRPDNATTFTLKVGQSAVVDPDGSVTYV